MEFERYEIEPRVSEEDAETAFNSLVVELKNRKQTLAVAESCTGGLIGKLITDVSGASAVFVGGMITYTNHIKISKLGVSADTVERFTEVSAECAAEMATRAREFFESDFGISATGFAGPTGESERDPLGTVYVGISERGRARVYRLSFGDIGREKVRLGTAIFAAKNIFR